MSFIPVGWLFEIISHEFPFLTEIFYFENLYCFRVMDNLKTEVIQIFDDDEIPVLVKKEANETPLLKSPEIPDSNRKYMSSKASCKVGF